MTPIVRAARVLALGAMLGACRDPSVTELFVSVDSDLSVPRELDEIRIDLVGPSGEVRRSDGALESELDLPRTLGLVHAGGPLGPIAIHVTGRRAGSDVVSRRAIVTFVPGRTLVLGIELLGTCVDVRCAATETCASSGCRPLDVEASELSSWTGSVGRGDGAAPGATMNGARLDASVSRDLDVGGVDSSVPGSEIDAAGADACVPRPERCNGVDDDCDGTIDDGFDLASGEDHCGRCNHRCEHGDRCCDGECNRECQR